MQDGSGRAVRELPRWALAVPTLVLVALVPFLGRAGLWRDEVFSVLASEKTPGTLWEMVTTTTDAGQAVYEFALMPILRLTEDPGWLRLPSLLGVLVAIAATTVTGARLGGRTVGVLAGGLLAANAVVWEHAVQVRPYGLVTGAAALLVLLVLTADLRRVRSLVGIAVLSALVVHLQVMGALLPVMLGLGVLVLPAFRAVRVRVLAAFVVAGAACVPLVLLVSGQTQQNGWLPLATPRFVVTVGVGLFGGQAWSALLLALVLGVGAVVAVRVAVRAGRSGYAGSPALGGRSRTAVLLFAALGPVVVLALVGTVAQVFWYRYLLVALPALAVLAALGLARLGSRALLTAGVVCVGLAVVSFVRVALPTETNDDPKGTAAFVAAHQQPGDVVVWSPTWLRSSVGYYLHREGADVEDLTVADVDPRTWPDLYLPELPRAEIRDQLVTALAAGRRVWLVEVPGGEIWVPTPNTSAEVFHELLPRLPEPTLVREAGDQRVVLLQIPPDSVVEP